MEHETLFLVENCIINNYARPEVVKFIFSCLFADIYVRLWFFCALLKYLRVYTASKYLRKGSIFIAEFVIYLLGAHK